MSLFEDLSDLVDRGEPAALLTVVDTEGSAPREVGTRMVVTDDAEYGTIGGGTVEGLAIDEARAVLTGEAESGVRSYELRPGGNTGMVCDGSMEVFIDLVRGQPRLYIAGCGHISQALASLATELDYAVTVIDDREAYADPGLFPDDVTVVHGEYGEQLRDLPMTRETAVLVATRSSTFDGQAIAAALDGGAGYVGFVASDTKAERVFDGLAEDGYSRADLADVRAPVGLDLGSDSPGDIALSILAELTQTRNDATGEPASTLDLSSLVVVKGGGDLGSGVVYRLHQAGYPVLVTEVAHPTVVRRTVAFATAMYEDEVTVEGVTARAVADPDEAVAVLHEGDVPVIADPEGTIVAELEAAVLVDATLAKGKRDTGTRRDDANTVIGLGPGFEVGSDVDAVVETDRGHELGRVYYEGTASAYDGEPGERGGYTHERVLRAPTDGEWTPDVDIGTMVDAGTLVGHVDSELVEAEIAGLVRGLVHGGITVEAGAKLGDVDPRGASVDPDTISDKALSIGGGVLEAVLRLE